jgi:REP element-mobilizing transposase RayT
MGVFHGMPRGPRTDFPGAIHHVYGRGIEKRAIFHDDPDRQEFLKRTGFNLSRWSVRGLAWALMPNHFHFLIESVEGTLPSFMRCLMTGYSLYFNRRHERVGHLFQNRYHSQALVKESHYRELLRYIHLNPLRAGLVRSISELEEYPWTGHRGIMTGDHPAWQDLDTVAEMFAYPAGSWREDYADFVREGWEASNTGTDTIIGGNEFPFDPATRDGVGGAGLHARYRKILDRVSAQTGVPAEVILGAGRKKLQVDARRQVLWACRTELGIPVALACRWLGISEGTGRYLLQSAKVFRQFSQC